MEVGKLLDKYIPLIDPVYTKEELAKPKDTSLLVTSPEEIQRNLEAWRKREERLHIVV
jgi:hypothetical protein